MLKFSVSANLSTFAFQVDSYKVLPAAAVAFVAHTLSLCRNRVGAAAAYSAGSCAFGRRWSLSGHAGISGGRYGAAYLLHMEINCGCFATPEPLTGMTVVRDGALAAAGRC